MSAHPLESLSYLSSKDEAKAEASASEATARKGGKGGKDPAGGKEKIGEKEKVGGKEKAGEKEKAGGKEKAGEKEKAGRKENPKGKGKAGGKEKEAAKVPNNKAGPISKNIPTEQTPSTKPSTKALPSALASASNRSARDLRLVFTAMIDRKDKVSRPTDSEIIDPILSLALPMENSSKRSHGINTPRSSSGKRESHHVQAREAACPDISGINPKEQINE